MRRIMMLLAGTALAGGTLFIAGSPAGAHVHLVTPLLCLGTDNANSGAAVGFDQAAAAAAPLQGPGSQIPQNASGKLPSGGQGAEHACG